ncbi:hypothetical protein Q0L85_14320, partial [Staphylococcus aureus]|nr:hypothetical protein [Staphylococcus aureus]
VVVVATITVVKADGLLPLVRRNAGVSVDKVRDSPERSRDVVGKRVSEVDVVQFEIEKRGPDDAVTDHDARLNYSLTH